MNKLAQPAPTSQPSTLTTTSPLLNPAWSWLSLAIIIAALTLTPLIFTTQTHELFEFPKMVFIYLLAIVSIPLICWKIHLDQVIRFPSKLPSFLITTHLLIFILSTIFSLAIYTSIMGYYTRFTGGLASLVAYLLLAWLAWLTLTQSTAQTSPQQKTIWDKGLLYLFGGWLISATIVAAWATLEHFGIGLSCWLMQGHITTGCWIQDVQARVFATFGQPNWLAAYLVATLPLSIIFGLSLKLRQQRYKTWLYWAWLGCLWLQFAAYWYTFSRAGWLGLAAATTLLVLLIPWRTWLHHRYWLIALLAGCLIISATTWSATSQRSSTTLESGDFDSSTGQMRLLVWQGAWSMASDHPWLGSGPETFPYSFLSHRPAAINQTTEWNFLYNKAHNQVLQTLTDQGWLGLLSWFGLWVILIYQAWSHRWSFLHPQLDQSQLFQIAIVTGLAGLTVSQFFGFAVVTTNLIWWLGLIIVILPTIPKISAASIKINLNSRLLRLITITATISTLVLLFGWWRYTAAEIYATQAAQDHLSPAQSQQYQLAAIANNPFEPYYQQQLASLYAQQAAQASTEDQIALAQSSLYWAHRAEGLNPLNLITKKQLGWAYQQLDQQLKNSDIHQQRLNLWQRAVKLAPTDASSWQSLAQAYLDGQQYQQAASAYQQLIQLRPLAPSYALRAQLWQLQGDNQRCQQDLKIAIKKEPWNNQWTQQLAQCTPMSQQTTLP